MLCGGNAIVFAIMLDVVNPSTTGLVTGLTNTFNMSGGPVFQLIIGILLANGIGHNQQYQHAIVLIPVCLVMSSFALFALRN